MQRPGRLHVAPVGQRAAVAGADAGSAVQAQLRSRRGRSGGLDRTLRAGPHGRCAAWRPGSLRPAPPPPEPEPEPEPEPAASDGEPTRDPIKEAEFYAAIYARRAVAIRRHGGMPPNATFPPPEDDILHALVTGRTPALLALDQEAEPRGDLEVPPQRAAAEWPDTRKNSNANVGRCTRIHADDGVAQIARFHSVTCLYWHWRVVVPRPSFAVCRVHLPKSAFHAF